MNLNVLKAKLNQLNFSELKSLKELIPSHYAKLSSRIDSENDVDSMDGEKLQVESVLDDVIALKIDALLAN